MKVLVCVKRVPAPGAKISITPDGQEVDSSFLSFTMSPHEECAVEEAVRIVEKHGGEATVLTLGPGESDEQLRYAISLGMSGASRVESPSTERDPQSTAAAITASIKAVETASGPFDLIMFGNESADSGGYQVGIRVAHALGRPMVNGIKGLEFPGDGTVVALRSVDIGFEEYRLPLPAVVGVKEGINVPRYPTLKGRLDSKKAPIALHPGDVTAGGQQLITLLPAVEQVSETVILGRGASAAPAAVDLLFEIGILK